jgi:hypothetical protein
VDVRRKFDSIRAPFDALFREFDEDERYVDGEYANSLIPDKWADDGIEPTVMPTAFDAVDNAANHILTSPRISVPVRPVFKNREEEVALADRKRAFLQAWWRNVAIHQGDPLKRATKSLIMGKMVLKKTIDWNLIPPCEPDATPNEKRAWRRKLEKIGRSKFIWKLEYVPRDTVYEDPSSPHDPRWVYEKYDIRVEDALELWGDAKLDNGKTLDETYTTDDADTKIQYMEYWEKPKGESRGRFVVFINEHCVHDSDNPYSWETPLSDDDTKDYDGYVPYAIEDPGWGEITKDYDPSKRYMSLIRPLRSLFRAETRQLTEVEAWLRLNLWSPIIGTNIPTQEDGEAPYTHGPGAFWPIDAESGQALDVLKMGEAPATAFQFMQKVQNTADRSSKFGALGGQRQAGVSTATENDTLMRNAAVKLSGPTDALRRAAVKINMWVLQDIELVIEAPITLYNSLEYGPSEITLKPKDINGFYMTDVQFETSDEASLNRANARLWADLYRTFPGLSERYAMMKAGIENPTDVQDERFIEELSRMEPMMQVAALLALTGLGDQADVVRRNFESTLAQPEQPRNPGDAGMLTQVDEQGIPQEAIVSEARQDFVLGTQAQEMFR